MNKNNDMEEKRVVSSSKTSRADEEGTAVDKKQGEERKRKTGRNEEQAKSDIKVSDNAHEGALASSATLTRAQDARYHVSSVSGTDANTFKSFFDQLGSQEADVVIEEGAPWQMALVRLNDTQLENVRNQTWLDYVAPEQETVETETDEFLVMSRDMYTDDHVANLSKRAYTEQDGPATQLKMISATPSDQGSGNTFDPNTGELYRYDDSAGQGQWIYIVDTGFDLGVSDLQLGNRRVETYTVPNLYTVGDLPVSKPDPSQDIFQRYRGPQDDSDIGLRQLDGSFWGHGTAVASAAGGLVYGVAKNANLRLVKAKGGFYQTNQGTESLRPSQYKFAAIERAFLNIESHHFQQGLDRAVINMSWGIKRSDGHEIDIDSPWGKFWSKTKTWAEANGVVIVAAAGNEGDADNNMAQPRGGDQVPQRFGGRGTGLIVVGALNGDGSYWTQTTRPGRSSFSYPNEGPDDFLGGTGTFAMGDNTVRAQYAGGIERDIPGTSIAAPQVAGVFAYLLGHPTNGLNWDDPSRPIALKAYDAVECLYDSTQQNGCFGVYWNGPAAINNGARFPKAV